MVKRICNMCTRKWKIAIQFLILSTCKLHADNVLADSKQEPYFCQTHLL